MKKKAVTRKCRITVRRILDAGFTHEDLGDHPPFDVYRKHDIEVWQFNKKHWLIDALDQAGVDVEFRTWGELEDFFTACKRDIYADERDA